MGTTGRARWADGAATALLVAVVAAPAGAADRYALANGCYALRAPSGAYVVKDALGYRATAATAAAATPVPDAGHRPRPLPALRPRRDDAGGGAARHRRADVGARARRRTGR